MATLASNEPHAAVKENASEEARNGYAILHAYPHLSLESRWLECLAHTTDPAHYASPAFFKELYFADKKPFAVLALLDGNVAGVLTGLHDQETVVSGLESRVHIAINERYDPREVISRLADGVEEESRGAKVVQVYSWHQVALSPFLDRGYRQRTLIGNPVLDLSLGAETLLKQFGTTHRRNINLAVKHGVEITDVTAREDFEEFYDVYDRWCTSKQLFKYAKEMEWRVLQETRNNRRLFVAKKDGKVIGGTTIRFFPGGLVEYSRNCSLPEFLRVKPNDLLMWHAIRWSCENHFSHYSMGAHHRFLRGFGGTMTPIDRYRVDRTLFRRHDIKDFMSDSAQMLLSRLPSEYENKIRKILGKEKPEGW